MNREIKSGDVFVNKSFGSKDAYVIVQVSEGIWQALWLHVDGEALSGIGFEPYPNPEDCLYKEGDTCVGSFDLEMLQSLEQLLVATVR